MPLVDYSFLSKILPKAKIKKGFRNAKQSYLNRIRLAASLFFFGMGFCFATWASRIPDIKSALNLSEAALGTLFFALPLGQLVAIPFSGKAVTRYGSRNISILGLMMYSLCLILPWLATVDWQLAIALFLFGFVGNFCNIAVNTQGVYTQQLFPKPIIGSFHGPWSLAGFCGAFLGLLMLAFKLSPFQHFVVAFFLVSLIVALNYKYIVKSKSKQEEKKSGYSFFKNPDKTLLWLGVLCFCGMASEGIMFDWSIFQRYSGGKYDPKKVLVASGIIISCGSYNPAFYFISDRGAVSI